MAKRYGKINGGEGGLIIIGLIIAFVIFLIKIIMYLIPIALIIYIIYQYSLWHEKRLKFYNNNFDEFYQKELKYKLQISLAILLSTSGFILLFNRPIVGFLILLVSSLFIPSIDNFLKHKLRANYNLKIKGLVIASLIATSLYSNNYYNNQDAIKLKEEAIIQKELEEEKKLNEEILSRRTDSLNNYLDLADKELTKKRNTGVRYASKEYIRGRRGGCYYINSNGNKTYVDRSLCN